MTGEELRALLARVEAATGANRQVDAEIAEAFGWRLRMPHGYWEAPRDWKQLETIEGLPRFTGSLDYALALVERVKPKGTAPDILLQDAINEMTETGWRDDQPHAPQIARWLLAGLLRAKIVENEHV